MVEVEVQDVITRAAGDEDGDAAAKPARGGQRVVLLRERGGEGRTLPIWIGQPEGDALAFAIANEEAPRPMSADLMVRLIESLGGRVEEVSVRSLQDDTFYATVTTQGPRGRQEIDARPSDAINLALRVAAAICVDEEVMERAGFAGDDLSQKLDEEERRFTGAEPSGTWVSVTPESVRAFWERLRRR